MSDDRREDQEQHSDTELTLLEDEAEERIRRVWYEGRWWFSIIDVIGVLTDSASPRKYWTAMKLRVEDEGFREVATNCRQLKMTAADGKQRLTDAADTETLLRIIQSIPSPKAEPFKQWLARVGTERLQELENPALAADHMRRLYKQRGYSDEWIDKRLQGIVVRDELTTEWRERGASEGLEFAILTDVLHRGTFDLSTEKHKAVKHLAKRDNLRDSMTSLELALTMLSEATSTVLHQAHDSQGFDALQTDAHEAGDVAGAARQDIEARTGQPVVSAENYQTLTARAQQPALFGHDTSGSGSE
jgi:DNA-damage-inducible protein D